MIQITVDPRDLRPSQTILHTTNMERARAVLASGQEPQPISISGGAVILDGHHRTRAALEAGQTAIAALLFNVQATAFNLSILELPIC